jgi:hypothetical protein
MVFKTENGVYPYPLTELPEDIRDFENVLGHCPEMMEHKCEHETYS